MTHIIHKKLFSLSFLCIATATYCMENNKSELTLLSPKKRYASAQIFTKSNADIELVLYYENSNLIPSNYFTSIEKHKNINWNGYSLLSFAAINFKIYPSEIHKDNCVAAGKYIPEKSPYEHRKEVVRLLLENGFIPTKKDRYVARKIEQEEGIIREDGKSDLLDQINQ